MTTLNLPDYIKILNARANKELAAIIIMSLGIAPEWSSLLEELLVTLGYDEAVETISTLAAES